MYIKKFFDADATEAAASTKYKITDEFSFEDTDVTTEDVVEDIVETEEEIIDTKVEDKVEDKAEEKVEEKPTLLGIPPQPDWREIVSKQDPKEVFKLLNIDETALNFAKELAADPYAQKFFTYRKENGNMTPFIEAASKDWDKIGDQQLILDDLKKQYSHLTPDKAEKLAKSDFNQRFVYKEDINLDEEENQELAELTALKLEAEAGKVRNLRKEEQQQFLDSVKPVDRKAEAETVTNERKVAAERELQEFKSQVERDPFYAKLNSEKKLTIGEGEDAFKYTVNPDAILEQTIDSNKFYNQFWKQEVGQDPVFDFELWSMVSAFSQNPKAYNKALINHGMSKGTGSLIEELENSKPKTDQQNQVSKKTLAKSIEEGQAFQW